MSSVGADAPVRPLYRTPLHLAPTIFSTPKAVLLACKAALCYDNIVFM